MKKDIKWAKEEIWGMDRNKGLKWKEEVLEVLDEVQEVKYPQEVNLGKELEDYMDYCEMRGYSLYGALNVKESGYRDVDKDKYDEVYMLLVDSKNQLNFSNVWGQRGEKRNEVR